MTSNEWSTERQKHVTNIKISQTNLWLDYTMPTLNANAATRTKTKRSGITSNEHTVKRQEHATTMPITHAKLLRSGF